MTSIAVLTRRYHEDEALPTGHPGREWTETLVDPLAEERLFARLEAEHFLETLWPESGRRADGKLVIFTLPNKHSYRFSLDAEGLAAAAAQAVRLSRQEGPLLDVYVGMGLTSSTEGKGTADDVTALPGAWADVDVLGPTHKGDEYPPTLDAAVTVLLETLPEPTLVVDSGGGVQPFWLSSTGPWYPAASAVANGMQHALRERFGAEGWGLDDVSNADRIMRVPGTWNWKAVRAGAETEPRAVRIHRNNGPRYTPGELSEQFPAPEKKRMAPLADFGRWAGEGDGTGAALRVLATECARVAEAREGERNRTTNRAVYTVAGLVAAGALDADFAESKLRAAAEDCGYANEPEFDGAFLSAWTSGSTAPWAPEVEETYDAEAEALLATIPAVRSRLKKLSSVAREEVSWLWEGWVPLGKLSFLGGDPGGGKTFLALKLCAAVTRGEALPGDTQPGTPGSAVYITLEDGTGDTLRPRAEDMGADLDRLYVIGLEDAPNAARIAELEAELRRDVPNLRLVVIDPLDSFIGGLASTGRANEMRDALKDTVVLAERLGCAVVIVTHTNKDSSAATAMHRIGGSLGGIAGFARAVLFVGEHGGRKAVAVAKCNLAPKPPAVTFSITDDGVAWGEELAGITADHLVTRQRGDSSSGRHAPKLEQAKLWLTDALAGGPRLYNELKDEADQEGISPSTLKDAKAKLRVVSQRPGGNKGPWVWELLLGEAWEETGRRQR